MPATAATKPKWRAHREVTVTEQRTERTATAAASDCTWGEKEGEYQVRELTVTIHSSHGDNAGSDVFVECDVSEHESGSGDSPVARAVEGRSKHRRFTLGCNSANDAHLGDLPLLVLALQEAIRIGVEQGTFPEIRGGKAK